MTDAIVSASAAATATSVANKSRANLTDNFSTFLTLLTAQLKNQDPLKPLDSNEFTSQLVQFSSVEQQISSNENLEKLVSMAQGFGTTQAVAYLGNTIELNDPELAYSGGTASWRYSIPAGADKVDYTIADQFGRTVKSGTLDAKSGTFTLDWDGKNGDGNAVPFGDYRLRISATDADDKALATDIAVLARATGVNLAGSTPLLETNLGNFALDKVRRIVTP